MVRVDKRASFLRVLVWTESRTHLLGIALRLSEAHGRGRQWVWTQGACNVGAISVHEQVEIPWVNLIRALGAGAPTLAAAFLFVFGLILVFLFHVVDLVYFFSFVCNVHISLRGVPSLFAHPLPCKPTLPLVSSPRSLLLLPIALRPVFPSLPPPIPRPSFVPLLFSSSNSCGWKGVPPSFASTCRFQGGQAFPPRGLVRR
mmetsp:Transcript_8676/g.30898  ORF Transcript_8676/g.30898 Transcript_8676/m.30898 type:complete len:201 (+) Transcript_8676:1098-1700(+)